MKSKNSFNRGVLIGCNEYGLCEQGLVVRYDIKIGGFAPCSLPMWVSIKTLPDVDCSDKFNCCKKRTSQQPSNEAL